MRDGGVLYLVLGIYFAVNAGLRLLFPGSLELEGSRLLFLAQWLEPGYVGHAPLAVWLQHGAARLAGAGVLAVVVLETVLLFLGYVFVGWAAFSVIRNRALAIIAVLGMLLLPQIVFEMQRDAGATATVFVASAFFIGALFAMLHRGWLLAYAALGIAISAGILSGQNVGLLLVTVLVALLPEKAFRARLVNWRMTVTLLFAGAALAPHLLWLRDNFDAVTAETIGRLLPPVPADRTAQIIEGLFSLAAALIGFVAPTVLVFWASFGRRFQESWQISSPWTRLLGRTFVLALLALILLVVLGSVAAIHDRWLVSVFCLLPLYFSLKLDALNQTIGNAPKRFGAVVLLVMIMVPLALAARVPLVHWTGRYTALNAPHQGVTEAILASIQLPPSLVLAEDAELAGNLRLAIRDIPVVTPAYAPKAKDLAFDSTRPIVVVWRGGSDGETPMPEPLRRLLAENGADAERPTAAVVNLLYRFGAEGKVFHLGYAWAYPRIP